MELRAGNTCGWRLLLLLLLLLRGLLGTLKDRRRRDRPYRDFAELLAAGIINRRANAHVNRKALPRMALVDAAHWCHVSIVATAGDADMPQADRIA